MTSKPYPNAEPDASFGRGFAMLRAKVARRLAQGPYARRVSIGLRRDLSVAVDPPTAKIPVSLRPFNEGDFPALFPAGCDASARGERTDVEWRLRAAAYGMLPSRCFVAIDGRSSRPCHIQWLTEPGYGDAIRQAGALPILAAEEAMLENAFTPVEYRGLGIMSVAVHLIAERAAALGKRYLVAYVDADNRASLKGVERAGFTPWSIRTRRQFGFGLLRTVRFDRIAGGALPDVHSVPGGVGAGSGGPKGSSPIEDDH
ncbi:GCN5 family acetyltransferase [Streptomyces purpurogeneiscleroticus]|nr:GCN5 family acetyltransferase [Streptomyces purpurogeneiscleroticus]